MTKKSQLILFMVLAVGGIALRFLPHPANFAPLGAIALFAGTRLSKKWAVMLPVMILLATDLWLGFYELPTMIAVYGCLALSAYTGVRLKNRAQPFNLLTASLGLSLIFFLLTNFSVWAFTDLYAPTPAGLALNYFMAVPFFKNTLLADLFYNAILFGAAELYAIVRAKILMARQSFS